MPAKRGAAKAVVVSTKAAAEATGPSERLRCSAGELYITRARTGNVRTYLSVKAQGEKPKLLISVSCNQSPHHEEIVQHVAQKVAKQDMKKQAATDLVAELLKSWPLTS